MAARSADLASGRGIIAWFGMAKAARTVSQHGRPSLQRWARHCVMDLLRTTQSSGWRMCCQALLPSADLLPLALLFWPARPVSAAAWYAVGALGILCTGIGFMLYFRLVKRAGAAYAMSSIFLVPIFGTLWGVCFLCERVTLKMILGCAI